MEEIPYTLQAQRIPSSLYSQPVNRDPTPLPETTPINSLYMEITEKVIH